MDCRGPNSNLDQMFHHLEQPPNKYNIATYAVRCYHKYSDTTERCMKIRGGIG